MNRIKARLDDTSESWIASIVLVLNLIKLIGRASLSQIVTIFRLQLAEEKYILMALKILAQKMGVWTT